MLMIDDFRGHDAARRKPKRIEPIKKPAQKSIHELAAEHDAAEAVKAAINGASVEPVGPIYSPIFPDDGQSETNSSPAAVTHAWQTPAADEHTAVAADETPIELPARTKTGHGFMSWRWTLGKKWTVVIVAAAILLLGAGGAFAYLNQPKNTGGIYKSTRGKYTPPITTVASNLTGLQVDPSVNQRPVTGIMIENSTDARPQSGLDQAGVVFEAIAEGGITRFLALFQDTTPSYIGPVRSVRPYYLQWCMGFDCAIAHVGGSPEALQDINSWGVKNLDQFYNAAAYHRISSRYAPHNMYTSMAKLNELEASKGFGAVSFTPFPRKKDAPSSAPNATSIDFDISGPDYNDHYDYDAKTNSYARSEGGKPHMVVDEAGHETQIKPKVVVALIMQYGLEADNHHSQYNVVGSGQAYVFQDGTVTAANWSKSDPKAQVTLTDANGQPLALNAGQTWFTALSSASLVRYQ